MDKCPVCCGDSIKWIPGKLFDQYAEQEMYLDWYEKYNGYQCQQCSTIYQNPMPDLTEYYASGDYRKEWPSDKMLDAKRADRILSLVEHFKIEPKSCLDIGCGRGELLRLLEIYYFAKIVGLEYDPGIAEIDDVVYSKDDVDGKFDLITCIHVMEHMPNPREELEWMLDKLNPGGTIILEIPTYISMHLPHLYVPTKKGLEMMLNDHNLDYLYINDNNIAIIIIGNGYSKYTAERVYYSYDSPDFNTPGEYYNWIRGPAYEAERKRNETHRT